MYGCTNAHVHHFRPSVQSVRMQTPSILLTVGGFFAFLVNGVSSESASSDFFGEPKNFHAMHKIAVWEQIQKFSQMGFIW